MEAVTAPMNDVMEAEGLAENPVVEAIKLTNYPNPFTEYTVICLPEQTTEATVTLTNIQGQQMYQNTLQTENGSCVRMEALNLPDGLFIYTVYDVQNGKTYQGKMIKN
jgi:uncharacterized protein (DUF2147 family)